MPKVIGVGPARKRAAIEVRAWICDGQFLRGEMLPSEQQMCDQLKVSRGTLRAALKDLEDEGVLQVKPGRGRVVAMGSKLSEPTIESRTVAMVTHLTSEPAPHNYGGDLSAVESGVVDGARRAGLHVLLMHMENSIANDLAKLVANPPLGLILGDTMANNYFNREAIVPFAGALRLVVNGNDDVWQGCDRVVSDHKAGAKALANWLLDRGCKRVLRVWTVSDDHYWVRDRNAGFEEAFAGRGQSAIPPVWVRGLVRMGERTQDVFAVRVRQMAGFLIEHLRPGQLPDAIAAASDSEAYYIAGAMRLMGIEPGRDILLAGYDNRWNSAPERQWEPATPVVTIDKLNHLIGEETLRLLVDRASGQLPGEPQLRLVQPKLVEVG